MAFSKFMECSPVSPGLLMVALGLATVGIYATYHHRSSFALYARREGESTPQNPRSAAAQAAGPGSSGKGSMKDRGFGEWTPERFVYPDFKPCLKPLSEIAPLLNRPWRSGTYHLTMGIRSMPWESWIELDRNFERYHRIRKRRIETRGDKAVRVLTDAHNPDVVKGGGLAAVELVHELAEYLSRRYPTTFRVTSRYVLDGRRSTGEDAGSAFLSPQEDRNEFCDWGWGGAPPIRTIEVGPTGEVHELPLHVKDGERAPERALEIAALLISDDLAIMIEGNDGKYYFQAGAILVAGFWRLEDKIGMPLEEIHTSGDVPFWSWNLWTRRSAGPFSREAEVRHMRCMESVCPCAGGVSAGSRSAIGWPMYEVLAGDGKRWMTSLNCMLPPPMTSTCFQGMGAGGIKILETSMARFFRRLGTDKPVMRNNYFMQVVPEEGSADETDPEELAWGTTTHGLEDELGTVPLPELAEGAVAVERMRVRTERQTLRRLGTSGAVVFTIRTYTEPVAGLGDGDGRRLAEGMRAWPAAVRAYKGADRGGWISSAVGYLET
ncbi:hypothetical protein D9611_002344 [Ephemerocybe angulata]|uniref:Uncharacterized protein n=1 Tax=Ephemerocybe angulata TaxID=980116 RepID=A0A8H5C3E0_9AGAR|nr:hypothetical protein D9611_002344 [Tulosesus angulatus]